jgi:NAD(P)-dependent dehydrogenase (short-subunit alcohol dehydrogenase family)
MKTIVVVGGSKGIGLAIVKEFVVNSNVISLSRTKSDFEHPYLTQIEVDVLNDELPSFESVDQLVYCLGSINLKPFNRLKPSDFQIDFEINVLGAVKVIQHFLPKLKQGINPSILLFSSVAAKMGMPFHASISIAKAGVEGLVKSLGAEFAPTIRINAIAPTVTDTTLASQLLRNETAVENMIQRHPLKKFLNTKIYLCFLI